jgi:hypothetical protein
MKKLLTSIAACSLLATPGAAQHPRYRVIDLGTLGGTYSFAFGINSASEVESAAMSEI